jgi:uncharacterized RDD family membrane protein YckC
MMGDAMRVLPDPVSNPELFDGLLMRRSMAWVLDSAIIVGIAVGVMLIGVVAGFLTLGVGFVALPVIVPFAILAYYAGTLGSHARSTVGMRAFDLVLTPARGRPLNGWAILIHPILFWVTVWISWPFSLLFALFTPRRQMLHDLVVGTLMVRRSPMEQHWRGMRQTTG